MREAHDKIAAGLREAISAIAHPGWQPIATVPKDGSSVLLFRPAWAYSIVMACWSTDYEEWWVDGGLSNPHHFTHWQPLPPPPALAETPHA